MGRGDGRRGIAGAVRCARVHRHQRLGAQRFGRGLGLTAAEVREERSPSALVPTLLVPDSLRMSKEEEPHGSLAALGEDLLGRAHRGAEVHRMPQLLEHLLQGGQRGDDVELGHIAHVAEPEHLPSSPLPARDGDVVGGGVGGRIRSLSGPAGASTGVSAGLGVALAKISSPSASTPARVARARRSCRRITLASPSASSIAQDLTQAQHDGDGGREVRLALRHRLGLGGMVEVVLREPGGPDMAPGLSDTAENEAPAGA